MPPAKAGSAWALTPGRTGQRRFTRLPYKIDVKSLVWYSPENFEDAGYEVPQTMEELKALTDQIVADGGTPWCIGLGSGGATGWPATDWVEDMMLRTQSPEIYDKWITNELAFNSPEVVAAIDEFGYFARNDAYVAGGAAAVASTDFRDSPKGLFSSPPQCYMHRQASRSFRRSSPKAPRWRKMPTSSTSRPMRARIWASRSSARARWPSSPRTAEASRAFIEWLKTPIAHEVWMAQSGFLTPLKSANAELYGNAALKKMGEILLNSTTFRFDGSDLMPGAVGAGTFWTGMVDYAGGKSAQEVADAIQASWPK